MASPDHPETMSPVDQVQWWASQSPNDTAVWERKLGIWQRESFAEFDAAIRRAASVLRHLGVTRGARIAIHSGNRAEWLHAFLGAQLLGAIPLGIYPTSSPEEVEHILSDAQPHVLVVEGDEELDKYFSLSADNCPVPAVVLLEPRERGDFEVDHLWPDLVAAAAPIDEQADIAPDDCALIVYTSGTTGPPKGAMLSYRNLTAIRAGLGQVFDTGPDDIMLSYLPLCHIAEQVTSIYLGVCCGATVAFAQSMQTVYADAVTVQPTVFAGVPRILEKLVAQVEIATQAAGPFRRGALAFARRTAHMPILRTVGRLLVLKRIARMIGLGSARFVFCAGAPVAPRVLAELESLGLAVVEGYGLTESSSVVVSSRVDHTQIGTVGQPLPSAEVRIDDQGEVRIAGEVVFLGYWNNAKATEEAIEDGWLHSGDIGEWTGSNDTAGPWDGESWLRITGRIKEIMITSGGKNIAPSEVENALLSSPYVSQAVAIADRRPYLTALVEIDEEAVGRWAASKNLEYTTYAALAAHPKVVALIDDEIAVANERLARVSQVRRFAILPNQLSQERGEITGTAKLRRKAIAESYSDLVADLYSKEKTS